MEIIFEKDYKRFGELEKGDLVKINSAQKLYIVIQRGVVDLSSGIVTHESELNYDNHYEVVIAKLIVSG